MLLFNLMFGHFIAVYVKGSYSFPWLEQISRQEILNSGCSNMGLKPNLNLNISQLDHVLVDHKHKFLYCYVPKVACTNWKRVLMVLTERITATDLMSIPANVAHATSSLEHLSEYNETQANFILRNYTSFIMVRQPFERLLSAYRNKLEDNMPSAKYFQARIGRYIIKNYRPNATETDLKNGDNVSFYEFVKYLIKEGISNESTNEHWKPIHQLCYPCSINYTFIGKYENFEEDSLVILNMVNASDVLFPHTRSGHTNKKLREYMRQLSLSDIQKLYKMYEIDFKLFDYNLENLLGFDLG